MKSSKRPISKQPARQKRVLLIVLILALLLAGGGAAWYFLSGPGSNQAQMSTASGSETYTTAAKRGDLRISADGSGQLVASQSVDLSFSTSGTLTQLNVKLGDTVKAGQVLASLGSSQTLESNVASAELQVLKAQKALTDLQQNANLNLAQAYSDLLTAQDNLDKAQVESQKVDSRRCSRDVTKKYKAALDQATQKLNNIHAETPNSDVYIAAKKVYDTALANYNYCASYTPDEKTGALSALDVAKTALQDAQDKYDTLKAASGVDPDELAMDEANLKEAQAQLTRAKEQLAGITLTSPIDGKITYLASKVGAMVGTDKFITIAEVNHPTLQISLDESDMNKLVVGAAATISFDALPDQSFTGKVVQVDPQITVSGQYRVAKGLVVLDSDSVKTISPLPLGLSATVTIVNKEAKNALLVPVIALRDLGDNTYGVMAKSSGGSGTSDSQLKLRIVTVGLQDSDYAEITSGLKEGDLVSTGTVKFMETGPNDTSSNLKNAQNSGRSQNRPGNRPPGQ